MRRILTSNDEDPSWSQRARTVLQTMRAEHEFLKEQTLPLIESGDQITWWTFAGGAANLLLARMLEAALGPRAVAKNTSIMLTENAATSAVAVREILERLRRDGRPTHDDARRYAAAAKRARLSKFEPCLPDALLADLIAAGTAAIAYTILACCRLAEVNPVEYLAAVLPRLARKVRTRDLPGLLPARWKQDREPESAQAT